MKLYSVYSLLPITIVEGKNCKLRDENGTEYLDFYGGHAVISIGHSHPHYTTTIQQQLEKIGFYSNSVINPLQIELAEKQCRIIFFEIKVPGYPTAQGIVKSRLVYLAGFFCFFRR